MEESEFYVDDKNEMDDMMESGSTGFRPAPQGSDLGPRSSSR
jgi:hypothetical protein